MGNVIITFINEHGFAI